MRYHALALDYDGTLAHHGRVDAETVAALERVKASGRRLLLVSGRRLEDLQSVFDRLDLFDRAVLENGGLLFDPATKQARALAEAPPPAFTRMLESRGVAPIEIGHVIVATWEPHETAVLESIRDLGLELQVIFNKGAVMVLPSGVNKATGLRHALDELLLSSHDVVGAGDAENDHAFLAACEFGVAVANALPQLKERADWTTPSDHGAGVRELIEALLADDLRALGDRAGRHVVTIGTDDQGAEVKIPSHTGPVLIAGTSGGGKTTLATSVLEQLAEAGYQLCLVDPEGDYGAWTDAAHFGDEKHAPPIDEVLDLLARPGSNAVVNLLGVPLADRPKFFLGLWSRLQELRVKTGRPHWLLVDETHHLLPAELDVSSLPLPREPHGLLFVTVDPESVSPAVLASVETVIAIGKAQRDTIASYARGAGLQAPDSECGTDEPGHGCVWLRHARPDHAPFSVRLRPPKAEHQRHVRKYASGELADELCFFFRGPEGKLNLRAQNLQVFLQTMDGVDDETWSFHLGRGDVATWFRDRIKDPELADEAAEIAQDGGLPPSSSRERIRDAVERRYTAPS